ncbi:uncharacterized protein MKK02DRAFT_24910 [Dioszegia hungarica]|uniref:DDH domain-containing protein n=1 Tax=Dioszegia hungarica TaxID=4972 RepID=A0AA38LVS2_9TREE|nr:uncharacterized protein MKK02DRAFT_24910 [Dioszegia hungarica]KAI9635701.1 hypothetical protein MKK02DRAFT_24910 [Dioszegia hungarica]
MPPTRAASSSSSPEPAAKRRKRSSPSASPLQDIADAGDRFGDEYGAKWAEWPAPRSQMTAASEFIRDIVKHKRSVLLVPDKDADGLSAGTILYQSLVHLGLPTDRIQVHHLSKGTNVHSQKEAERIEAYNTDKIVVLDQGSRPGEPIAPARDETPRVLIIDHHQSAEWPDQSLVLTACNTPPIATAALLTYSLVRDLHPRIRPEEGWRALVGVFGDLGPSEAKWGKAPWPAELGDMLKSVADKSSVGSKNVSDAVAAVNAPRRTADYNVPRAWDIMLQAKGPKDIANHAYLKLCKIDVKDETEKWARTAPKFSLDGRVAVVTIDSAFQIHPVIATRWAGNLGRKSKKLIMVMCANMGYNPDPAKVSFSCRIAASLRDLPDEERPNLIALLKEYGDMIPGFRERVGEDFARGHKEATGGIIQKVSSPFCFCL